MAQQSQPTGQKQKRNVVSSLIFTFPNGESSKPKVALFRRSDKVRTYPHHLAPISGNIDPTDKDPLSAAWRELHEETTLTPANLTLWRVGKPFTFSDSTLNREWTVHPFAFKLKPASQSGQGEAAIRTDWEHESWEWHDPDSIVDDEAFGGVPRLRETLRRVFPECEMAEHAGEALASGLKRLREDHKSGAHELTSIALMTFREVLAQMHDEIDETWWWRVRMAAWHLVKNGRESMGAATLNALLSVLVSLDEILNQTTDNQEKRDRILSAIDSHLANRQANTARLKEAFTSYIQTTFPTSSPKQDKDRITMLTLSASSTTKDSILHAFASANIPTLELRILESRPLFEGTTLASSIYSRFQSEFRSPDKKQNLDIKIYTDAAAALAAQNIDIVLLGADRICASKGVSNKIGSLPVVLSAKHVAPSAKILVLSELEKVVGDDGILEDKVEDNDPEEVFSAWRSERVEGAQVLEDSSTSSKADTDNSATIQVKNIYFEWVPLMLVDAFVSDEGVLDQTSIKNKSQQLGKLASKYFDDL